MHPSRTRLTRPAVHRVLSGLAFAASLVGCANLIGVKEGEWDGKVADETTDIRTSPLCVEYCDEVMANCTGEFSVYQARQACLHTCNALPVEDPTSGEPDDNTVDCRLRQAKNAKNSPSEFCPGASPGGADACGSNCESWCILLEAGCPDDFETLSNCEQACTGLPQEPGFSVAAGYDADADNLQCRISHLGAALEGGQAAIVHCPHTAFTTSGNCASDGTGPSCDAYCATITGACADEHLQYGSLDECRAACESLPLGEASDRAENTVGCRAYHAGAALSDPQTHCAHAGPTGDGTCGASDSGICESYCAFFASGCEAAFVAQFGGDFRECADACLASGLEGAAGGSRYTRSTSLDADGIACRVRRALEAAMVGPVEGAEECAKASIAREGRVDCTEGP